MILDEKLTFETHVRYTYKKICNKVGVIGKINDRVEILLYKSIILPVIDYGDVVYMTTNKTVLNKLQQIQKLCCRIILHRNKRASVTEMHNELQLLKFDDRRDLHLSELCHKNIYYDTSASLSQYFIITPARNYRATRQRNKSHILVPRTKNVCGQKALGVRGPTHLTFDNHPM